MASLFSKSKIQKKYEDFLRSSLDYKSLYFLLLISMRSTLFKEK